MDVDEKFLINLEMLDGNLHICLGLPNAEVVQWVNIARGTVPVATTKLTIADALLLVADLNHYISKAVKP